MSSRTSPNPSPAPSVSTSSATSQTPPKTPPSSARCATNAPSPRSPTTSRRTPPKPNSPPMLATGLDPVVVAAEFHAKDALRGALRFVNDLAAAERCRRQHALMMRTMHSGLRALLRMQAERHKAEDAMRPAAMLRAGHLHSGVLPPEPQPAPMPKYEDMTEAEQYAVIYPDRAAAIRRHGGMPPGAKYPPPDDAVFTEIVTGNSPVFLALDAEHAAEAVAESEISSHTTTP